MDHRGKNKSGYLLLGYLGSAACVIETTTTTVVLAKEAADRERCNMCFGVGRHLRQYFLCSVDPSESHNVRDEVKQELEGVVAQLVRAAAVPVEHQVTPRVQGESIASHARKPHESVAVLVPGRGLEGKPKGLLFDYTRVSAIVCTGGAVVCVVGDITRDGVCRSSKGRAHQAFTSPQAARVL